MTEKPVAKKDKKEKAKKPKPNEKTKKKTQGQNQDSNQNGLKNWNKEQIHLSHYTKKKEKNKMKSESSTEKTFFSFVKSSFIGFMKLGIYACIFLGFLYVIDYDKFCQIRNGFDNLLTKAISYLPEGVVSTGRAFIDYVQPAAKFTFDKLFVLLGQISNYLSTNPLFKEHWINIKEISSICSASMIDYLRTLYRHVTGFCLQAKSKLFQ